MKRLLFLAAPIMLSGCYVQTADLQQHIAAVQANTQVSIEPYPEFHTQPPFKYEASELRSPFHRPRATVVEAVQTLQANCLQPDFGRTKGPLEGYGLDALTVSGVFTSAGRKWALITANDGSLHKATAGDYLGLFFGKITSIENGTLSITEMMPDGAGCWLEKHATLSMASQTGENDNV